MHRGPAPAGHAWSRSIPFLCLALALVLLGYHLQLEHWYVRHPSQLGALRARHLLPLIALPRSSVSLWVLPALVILAGFVAASGRLYLRTAVRAAGLLALSIVLFFAIGTSVAMIDGYRPTDRGDQQPAVLAPYTAPFVSYNDVPKVEAKGVAAFLRGFARRPFNESLANHSRTHPPGTILFLWAVGRAFGPGLVPAWLATVLFTSLATVLVFLMARDLYGEAVARRALALFLLVPSVVLFTTTSLDGPMSVLLILALWSVLRATDPRARGIRRALLSGLALALAAFMTYSASFLVLFFAVMAVLAFFTDRARFWGIVCTGPVAALSFAAFYVALYFATGYDPVAAVRRSVWANNQLVGSGHATLGQYLEVSTANLTAFLVGAGLALVVVWARQVRVAVARARAGEETDLFVLAFPIALLIITFSTLYTLEVERIWMFMAPFLVLAGARYLHEREKEGTGHGPFHWTAALLALQVLVMETFSDTLW